MTLHTLRNLLALAHGPAVERLPDRGVEAVARAYLARNVNVCANTDLYPDFSIWRLTVVLADVWMDPEIERLGHQYVLDLTDPGTVNAIKTALALALGLDPGPMGLTVSWFASASGGWALYTGNRCAVFSTWRPDPEDNDDSNISVYAPLIATEPDPIKALVLACEHVIKEQK